MNEHLERMTPAARLIGKRIDHVDDASATVDLGFFAPESFANRHGTVHGGFLSAMLDSAAATAVHAGLAPGMQALTMRLDTHYHRPAPLGEYRARARVVARDERTALVEAELYATDGVLVASARATFRVRPRR